MSGVPLFLAAADIHIGGADHPIAILGSSEPAATAARADTLHYAKNTCQEPQDAVPEPKATGRCSIPL